MFLLLNASKATVKVRRFFNRSKFEIKYQNERGLDYEWS